MSDDHGKRRRRLLAFALLSTVLGFLLSSSAVEANVFDMSEGNTNLEFVTVANPGNPGEMSSPQVVGAYEDPSLGLDRICGAVDYVFQIGKYEVTNAQYCEFLNAVAASDPHDLYNPNMGSMNEEGGGIVRSGTQGNYTYSTIPGRANKPVKWVSFWDACRFANWLHNGQGDGDTETGAYTLTPERIADNTVSRNTGWRFAVTSEDEWYKAAYHKNDGATGNYWDYPTGSDTPPTAETAPGTDMVDGSANYDGGWGDIEETDVGAYTARPASSPYGTFDQGGNAWEWNETPSTWERYAFRGVRGGEASSNVGDYAPGVTALHAMLHIRVTSAGESNDVGFRVAKALAGVHRIWSGAYDRHFYTTDEFEKAQFLQDTAKAWQDEGVVYHAFADACEPNVSPVFRFYSAHLQSHFYTISESEKDKLLTKYADVWSYEKIAFYVFPPGRQPDGTSAVHRFWSDVQGYHFYTISETEKDKLIDQYSHVWTYEGIAWYAYAPVYAGKKRTWFPAYMPSGPDEYGVKVFEWTYGRTGTYTSEITGSQTVPYTSGPVTGVQVANHAEWDTALLSNDGADVRFLGFGQWYLSTDPDLGAHPPAWSFAGLYDGMIIDDIFYKVATDQSSSERTADQVLLIGIQDVTVPAGRFDDAVVIWYLDAGRPFTPIDLDSARSGLDLSPSAGLEMQDYAVTRMEIYGQGTGLVAHGDINAATGRLVDLAVLVGDSGEDEVPDDPDGADLQGTWRVTSMGWVGGWPIRLGGTGVSVVFVFGQDTFSITMKEYSALLCEITGNYRTADGMLHLVPTATRGSECTPDLHVPDKAEYSITGDQLTLVQIADDPVWYELERTY